MQRKYSAIDRGFIKSEDFELLNSNSSLFPLEKLLYINFEIPLEFEKIFEESNRVFLIIKCDETRLRYKEELEKINEKLNFSTKVPIERLGSECVFSLYCVDENDFVIYKSYKYKVKVDKPKLNIQIHWISFKDHERFQWKKYLFWVIEILNHETINIYFNKDINEFEEFVKRSHVKIRDKQSFLWALIGQHLKMAQRFSLEIDIAFTEDDSILDNYINNLATNNTFFKIADIDVDEESSELKLRKREAIFPFLKRDLEHKGEGDPWLWLSGYLQTDILSTIKKLIKI